MPPLVVCVEANIGAGKSSALDALAREGLPTFPEPVGQWAEWLALFYADPGRWALAFQLKVLTSFVTMREPLARSTARFAFVERSPASCRGVFGQNIRDTGHWTPLEGALFDDVYAAVSWNPDLHVVLRVSPELCWQRMQSRGRDAEDAGVTRAYIDAIDRLHEVAFAPGRASGAPVVHLDIPPEWTPEQTAARIHRAAIEFFGP